MANVYFIPIDNTTSMEQIQEITQRLLAEIIQKEDIRLEKDIPIKIHFGEKENKTFIPASDYEGIISFLKEKQVKTEFIETTVLYNGQRHTRTLLLKTAKEHGFDQLPVICADGDVGEEFTEVEINQKHFKTCKIGKEFFKYRQMIIAAHFKGHMIAGFGGAIKQLGMGCASKGGKLAMHMGIKPQISNRKCHRCKMCLTRCRFDAITIGKKSFINHEKCVGCGACFGICPYKAISIMSFKAICNAIFQGDKFKEKLVEYAYAAQKGKKNIYINFGKNVTKGCDCEPKSMPSIVNDFGIFISLDPVAIDKACYDMVEKMGKKFKGKTQFIYGEKIGLGTTDYQLIEIK